MAREPRTQQKPAGFVSWLGLCALGRKSSQGECGIGREEERKEGMGKERREERGDKEGRGGGGEQRGREERELKGSEEERKCLVRAWCFWGNPPPRRLLTQGVFCGVVHLLRSSFFVAFTCKQQCILIPGETYSALILVVEGIFLNITCLRNLLRPYSSAGKKYLTSSFYEKFIPALIG